LLLEIPTLFKLIVFAFFVSGGPQWRAEGGANRSPAPGIQGKGASKE